MRLKTRIRNCLYLNWALPAAGLGPPPSPLRYELHSCADGDYVLASALLFHQERMHAEAVPFLKLAFDQFNLRLYVLDQEGVPSVFFVAILVPPWVTPAARFFGRQPVHAARIRTQRVPDVAAGWRWEVEAEGRLRCRAVAGPPAAPSLPLFPSWQATVDYVRPRTRGYVLRGHRLSRIDAEHPPVETVPMQVEIDQHSLLANLLGQADWSRPHSAWVCTDMPMIFDLVSERRLGLAAQAPVPG